MANFVTDLAIFKCAASAANLFKCSDSRNRTVKKSGLTLLTKQASLNPIIAPCVILTMRNQGAFTPCSCRFSGWHNCDMLRRAHGENLLSANSFVTCQETGAPVKLLFDPGQNLNPVAQGFAFPMPIIENLVSITPRENRTRAKTNLEQEKLAASGSDVTSHSMPVASPVEMSVPEKAESCERKASETATAQSTDSVRYKCEKCQKKNCPHRADTSKTSTKVNNNSQLLLENYDKATGATVFMTESDSPDSIPLKKTKAHKVYLESHNIAPQNPNQGWRYAAHHLISGNQVFAHFTDLALIANQCGYDINNARNCIMLPTNETGFGTRPSSFRTEKSSEDNNIETGKKISAWDTMSLARMQWHVGGHSYMKTMYKSNDIELIKSRIKFFTKTEPDKELRDYAALLTEELSRISAFFNNKPVCGAAFVERLDNICAKIRTKLAAFAMGYHKSFPWYVSRESFAFSFELPQAFTLIAARKRTDQLLLEKYRISRKQQNPVTVVLKDKKVLNYPLDDDDARHCILFCSNVRHFIFLGRARPAHMPFGIDPLLYRTLSSGNTDLASDTENNEGHIRKNASEYLVWIQQTTSENYVAPLEMIRRRMKEFKERRTSVGGM